MPQKYSEKRLVDVLTAHYRKTHSVRREVKHYEKHIDVVTYCNQQKQVDAIEAKMRDWQRAIQQAILNLTAADFCYVAIWAEAAHLVQEAVLEEYGIGLIAVGTRWGDVDVRVKPKRSPYTNRFVREEIGQQFNKVAVR